MSNELRRRDSTDDVFHYSLLLRFKYALSFRTSMNIAFIENKKIDYLIIFLILYERLLRMGDAFE